MSLKSITYDAIEFVRSKVVKEGHRFARIMSIGLSLSLPNTMGDRREDVQAAFSRPICKSLEPYVHKWTSCYSYTDGTNSITPVYMTMGRFVYMYVIM